MSGLGSFVPIVDETSDRSVQPSKIKMPLKPHQLGMIKAMNDLEKKEMVAFTGSRKLKFQTRIGALCDDVGAGKSLTMLGVIANEPVLKNNELCVQNSNYLVQIVREVDHYIGINIIVVPHGIISQWKSYLEDTELEFDIINTTKKSVFLNEKIVQYFEGNTEYFDTNEILLVSSSQYQRVQDCFTDITVSRLVVDEIETIKIASSIIIESQFLWYISSSTATLFNPNGYYVYVPYQYQNWQGQTINTERRVTKGRMTHNGEFKNVLRCLQIAKVDIFDSRNQIFLKCDPEFVQRSFMIPHPNTFVIECKGNVYTNVLNGIVPQNIMSMINAGDINSAMSEVGWDQETETNLIKLVTADIEDKLENKKIELDMKSRLRYRNERTKLGTLAKIREEIEELEGKIENIKTRIKDNESCPICMDTITNKVILKCCNNSFCFACLTMSLQHKQECPLCRKSVSMKDVIILQKEQEQEAGEKKKKVLKKKTDKSRTKIENLEKYLGGNTANKKILIFSEFETSLTLISEVLTRKGLRFSNLKGNTATINKTIRSYKEGPADVLLLNSKFFGSGLNLENTTDMFIFHKMSATMENQVIGRAQRPGRTCPLNIYKLYHENEIV